jgi:hypothetical protein
MCFNEPPGGENKAFFFAAQFQTAISIQIHQFCVTPERNKFLFEKAPTGLLSGRRHGK